MIPKTTDYVGEYVYENDMLQFINHEEGRIVMTGPIPEYQYYLKDHLGNVRVTFSEKRTSIEHKTDLEATTNTTFRNYTNRSSFGLFDHTDASTTYTYSQQLSAGNNSQVGLAKSFAVNPGDVVDLEVYAKYEAPMATAANPSALFNALVSAFNLSPTGTVPLEGAQAYNRFNNLFAAGPIIGPGAYEDDLAPKAYLNYLLFDENFNLIDFGYDQISNSAGQAGITPVVPHDYLNLHVKVSQKGFLYVYLSNEQAVLTNVYFDDFKIVHHTGVESSSAYYPFGFEFNSYQRENSTPQDYKFSGKELQDELSLGWYDFGFRMYQPEIGRWSAIDPLAENHHNLTPYNYVLNNPLRFIDPNGMDTTIYVFDQKERPKDNGTQGETYTAEIYIDADGNIYGPFSGSSYPNSKSNTDNSTNSNTVDEGEHDYSNEFGHKSGAKKGLNLGQDEVETQDDRTSPGKKPDGTDVTMKYVNVHTGASDNGNHNSRGSEGCITIKPDDVDSFMQHFDWSGSTDNTGNSKGTIKIFRGETNDSNVEKQRLVDKQSGTRRPRYSGSSSGL